MTCFRKNLQSRKVYRRREYLEASQWFFDTNGVGPFSLESVCEVLEIDPGYVRHSLAEWRRRTLAAAKLPKLARASSSGARSTPKRLRMRLGRGGVHDRASA